MANLLMVIVCANLKTNGVGGNHGQNVQVPVGRMASKPGRENVGLGRVHVRDAEGKRESEIDKTVRESGQYGANGLNVLMVLKREQEHVQWA